MSKCNYFITDSLTGFYLSGFDPVTSTPTWSADENDAYCFGTEDDMLAVLSFINQGGTRFVGHRPPKPH